MTDAVVPFRIAVPDEVLADLRDRLARTRWPDQLADSGWTYGTDLSFLQDLCDYWRDGFDWRAAEARLNAWPQFETTIEGTHLHFIHARSKHADAMPLCLTHGWPGSIAEFLKVLGPLTDPTAFGGSAEDAFHVVAPSMPGYGFSDPTTQPGFDIMRVARTEAALMARLGYDRYGAQGGDWGAVVTLHLGVLDAAHLTGVHVNMVAASPADPNQPHAGVAERELDWIAAAAEFARVGAGYQKVQQTQPQSLAYGLTDSPSGLAGWIVEKFRSWSDCGGDVLSRFTRDELLTNITIYWVTNTINSSMRLYRETYEARSSRLKQRVKVPVGVAVFPKEIYRAPRAWADAILNVTQWTEMAAGGHFAAMEEPAALVHDMRKFFRTVRE
jgi:pimeloyl-ACP methyl ester carboxylesterase